MQKFIQNHSFFTSEQILQAKHVMEQQFGFQLDLINANDIQTILVCHNQKKYKCGFIYLFRKKNGNKDQTIYNLITQFQSHNENCVKENQKKMINFQTATPKIRSSSFSQYSGTQTKNSIFSPLSILKNYQMQKEDQQQKIQEISLQKDSKLIVQNETKFLDQFAMLKKQLQIQSKGLLSKSTQFNHVQGYATKIKFICKFDQKCPFLVQLHLKQQKYQSKFYEIKKINTNHLQSCILDQQQICFNITIRKIDKNMSLLIQIIQNNTQAKPKAILQKFTKVIGQKTQNFIYDGLSAKLKKRAIKKYFDNSVAKAKNLSKCHQLLK